MDCLCFKCMLQVALFIRGLTYKPNHRVNDSAEKRLDLGKVKLEPIIEFQGNNNSVYIIKYGVLYWR